MPLELALPPDLEARLRTEATRQGEPIDRLAIRLLDQQLPTPDQHLAAVEELSRWASEAEHLTEDEATENAAILNALDDDRPSHRKLFTRKRPETDS